MSEILSPVGSIESFYAAINSNADAIYLAGTKYGARASASKFDLSDIKFMINTAHLYKVKVYITINTLIYDDEIEDLLKFTDELYLSNVDAFIIQDLGLLNIFSKRYPVLDLHISTQDNIKSVNEALFFEKFKNVKRIVLARETPIETIKEIKEKTNLEVEVFVHGAICMSYSGNCLFSSMLFSKSGNRGECLQPCRLNYSLLENGIKKDEGFLLSPKELCTIDYLDELINIGVDSFKIEGRAKSPEYVAYVTKVYKEKLLNKDKKISEIEIENLKRIYNRSFTKGYIFSENPKDIVNSFRPNHQGIILGEIIKNDSNYIKIKLENELNRLDGIRILSKDDIGLTVDKILYNNKEILKANKGMIVDIISYKLPKKNLKGSKVLITNSIKLKIELEEDLKPQITKKCTPLNLKFIAKIGDYPKLILSDDNTIIEGNNIVQKAIKNSTNYSIIKNQIDRFEMTPYYIEKIDFDIDDDIFLPLGLLNQMRRDLVSILDSNTLKNNRSIVENYAFNKKENILTKKTIIKVETMKQFKASVSLGFKDFYIYNYSLFKKLKDEYKDYNITLMTDRINKYNDYSLDSLVINEVGSIIKYNSKLIGNAYLNPTNIYALNLLNNSGVGTITLSHELSGDRIKNIINNYKKVFNSSINLELIIYGKVDLMITKYCVISRSLNTNKGCMMCTKNIYELKDRENALMRVIGTSECGNRILNSKTLCLFKYIKEIENSGINNLRIDFTIESYDEVINVLKSYKDNNPLVGEKYTHGRFLK